MPNNMGWFKDLISTLEEYYEDGENWINIDITIMTPYSELIKLKSALKPYAEELDWEIESGSQTHTEDNTKIGGEKIKRVNVTLRPKGGSISPIEFLNNKDKIMGLEFSIHRDIFLDGNIKETINFKQTWNITSFRQGNKSNKDDYIMNKQISFLTYSYKLIDRIKFEDRNKTLALELFETTTEEDLRKIFKPEEKKETESKKEKIKKTNKESEDKEKYFTKQMNDLEEKNKRFKLEIEELFGFKL